jgi:uncharacterized protein (TIGR02147 family)
VRHSLLKEAVKKAMKLFNYLDYRQYLKDRYTEEKAKKGHFSHRYFARIAGLSSVGFLKMVMDGKRNLSPSTIHQFAKALKFNKKETAYFEALVLFNQAKEDRERDLYFERLTSLKPPARLTGIEKDQYEYYTQKHFVVIREMVALPHFQDDPEWIAKRLSQTLKTKEVEHAIEVLLRLGLLKRNKAGKLVHSDTSLTTPAEVQSTEVYHFHQSMLNEAKDAMLKVKPELRDITALTIPIPLETLKEIKDKIREFREQMIDVINKGSDNYHDVYQLNIQLFPVTASHCPKETR